MSGSTIQDPTCTFFLLPPSLPAPFHLSNNTKVPKIQESESIKEGLPRFVEPRISHMYIPTRLGLSIKLLPWRKLPRGQNQLRAAALATHGQQIKHRRSTKKKKPIRETSQGLPSQGTSGGNGDKRARNQQPRTERVRERRGLSPKDRRRRLDGGCGWRRRRHGRTTGVASWESVTCSSTAVTA